MMLCFAPLVLVGAATTLYLERYAYQPTSFDGPVVDLQTCERGPGVDVRYGTAGIGSVMAQYGLGQTWGDWSFTVSPKVGVGLLDRQIPEQSGRVNFSLAGQVVVGYGRARVAVDFWHQSNADLGDRNAGVNIISVMGGIAF